MTHRPIFLVSAALLIASCAPAQPSISEMASAPGAEPRLATPDIRPASEDGPAPDAVLLVAVWGDEDDGGMLRLMDARTGTDVPGHDPIFIGGNYWHAISPDGRTLAVFSLPQGNSPVGGSLRVIDLEMWSPLGPELGMDLWPTMIVFSPDGSRLAVGGSTSAGHKLIILDPSTRTVLAESSPDFDPLEIVFTPDGVDLMVYGARYPGSPGINPTPIVARVDVSDLRLKWESELSGIKDGQYVGEGLSDQATHDASIWWRPAVVFAPRGERLYIVHADAELLTVIDFAQRSRRTIPIRGPLAWIDRLMALGAYPAYAKELNGTRKAAVVSPDGESLFVVGERIRSSQDANGGWDIEENSLGLEVIALETGKVLATADTPATQIAWSPDHKFLLVGGWDRSGNVWTDTLEVGSLKLDTHLENVDLLGAKPVGGAPLMATAFTRSGPNSRIQLLDTTSWELVRSWTIPGYADVWDAGRPGYR